MKTYNQFISEEVKKKPKKAEKKQTLAQRVEKLEGKNKKKKEGEKKQKKKGILDKLFDADD